MVPRSIGAMLAGLVLLAAAVPATGDEGRAPLLVEPDWLHARLRQADLRIVDASSDPAAYARGHIPGAVYLHVNDARVRVAEGGYRLPTPAEGARLLGALGVGPDTHVVIYDDAGGVHAARLFYTLDVLGHERVSVLDGGSQRWRAAGLRWTRDAPRMAPAVAPDPPRGRPDRVASAEWVRERLGDRRYVLLDARSPEEFAGRDVRARRGGHIPGAVNIDWRRNLRSDGTFRPADELRALYEAAGVTPDRTVVTYCQTHHRAAHTYFVLRLLGYPRVVAYERSWAEWGNREDLPVAR